jgi:hypothetical protein
MKTLKTLVYILFAAMLISSCSKEAQLENRLERGNGIWNVDEIAWAKANVSNNVNAGAGIEYNAGSFTFNDDGTGSYDYKYDGIHKQGTFKWSNSAASISADVALSPTKIEANVYTVVESHRKTQIWSSAEASIGISGIYNYTATLKLSR